MNNSVFISDSLKNNISYDFDFEKKFISNNELDKLNDKKINIKNYNNEKNNQYNIKSAIARKWSIKFR